MSDPPLFDDLIVSRPDPRHPRWSRGAAIAAALSLHLTLLGGMALSPFIIIEVMQPPKASVADPPIVQPPLRGTPHGDNLRAALVRRGETSARPERPRHVPAQADRPASPPATRPDLQPRQVPVPPPAAEETSVATPEPLEPSETSSSSQAGSPGDPGGTGDDPVGTRRGTRDGQGRGPRGPGMDDDSIEGPYDPGLPGLTQPILIPASRALPRYPDLARRAGISGSVILMIVIGADGAVGEVQVIRSPEQRWGFDLAAIEAVKQWRYRPGLMHGEPVAVYAQVMIEFTLSR